MFSAEETRLLQELVEKHLHNLDTSLTRDSIETRNKAWDSITEEFNWANVNNIPRDQLELKTKVKNLKAQRVNFKTDTGDDERGKTIVQEIYIDAEHLEVDQRTLRTKAPVRSSLTTQSQRSVVLTRQKKTNEEILDSLDPDIDYSDDDDEDVS